MCTSTLFLFFQIVIVIVIILPTPIIIVVIVIPTVVSWLSSLLLLFLALICDYHWILSSPPLSHILAATVYSAIVVLFCFVSLLVPFILVLVYH